MGKSLSEASNMSQMLQESRAGTEQGRDMRAGAPGRAARVHGATRANLTPTP